MPPRDYEQVQTSFSGGSRLGSMYMDVLVKRRQCMFAAYFDQDGVEQDRALPCQQMLARSRQVAAVV